jgi:hypothetical protein
MEKKKNQICNIYIYIMKIKGVEKLQYFPSPFSILLIIPFESYSPSQTTIVYLLVNWKI